MITLEEWRRLTTSERFARRNQLTEAEREHLLEAIRNEPLPPDYVPQTEGVVPVAVGLMGGEAYFTIVPVVGWTVRGLDVETDAPLDSFVIVSVRAGRLDLVPGLDAKGEVEAPKPPPIALPPDEIAIWPSVGLSILVRNHAPRPLALVFKARGTPFVYPILPKPPPRGGFEFL